jgi:choline dehydrogenase-like flavoprotein
MGRTAHLTKPTDEQIKIGRGTCQTRNLCMRGCSFGAYFSSNAATLIAADHTGNMTLAPDSIVTEVIFDPKANKATGVRVKNGNTGEMTEYFAKVIFLNASALATTWIMLHSKSDRFPNGLGNDSDELGRNVMDHHFLAGAQSDVDGYDDRYYAGRRPTGIYVPRFRNLGDSGTRQKDFTRGYGYQGGASRSGWQRLVAEIGFGRELKEEISEPGKWTMGLTGFGEMLPYRDNRVWLNNDIKDVNGLPTLTMDVTIRQNELNMRKDMQSAAVEMMETAGFKNVRPYDRPYAPGLGIHEMGTARMGRDAKTSVLNANNQLHACKNVYVTDGAAMTSAACVNPSLTYMALTVRAADHAVNALKRGEL